MIACINLFGDGLHHPLLFTCTYALRQYKEWHLNNLISMT
ncbi:hypothetical protein YPPY103_3580, partial [Yersinia pestis PY-103]